MSRTKLPLESSLRQTHHPLWAPLWIPLWAAVLMMALAVAASAQPPEYDIHHLGEWIQPAPPESAALAINHRGVVVGYYDDGRGDKEAVLWDLDREGRSVVEPLDPPCPGICFASDTYALDVNDHDEVVGFRSIAVLGETHATYWNARESRPRPKVFDHSRHLAINNESNIAGYEDVGLVIGGSGPSVAAYRLHWYGDYDGTLVTGWDVSTATDINDSGDVVGTFREKASDPSLAYFLRGLDKNTDRPRSLPLPAGVNSSRAEAVNNRRSVAGTVTVGGQLQACLWLESPTGGWLVPEDLHDRAATSSQAYGINDLNHVVGSQQSFGAFLWQDGQIHDLNQSISPAAQQEWTLLEARDINDRGEIVGIGLYQGKRQAFLLTPRRDFDIYALDDSRAINDAGQILVVTPNDVTGGDVFRYDYGSSSPELVSIWADAHGLDDGGRVAGVDSPLAGYWPTLWQLNGSIWSNRTLAGGQCAAQDVSEGGQAAGHCFTSQGKKFATFWNRTGNGPSHTVPANYCTSSENFAINASGHTAGTCVTDPFFSHFTSTRWSERDGFEELFSSAFRGRAEDIDSRGMAVGWQGDPSVLPPGLAPAPFLAALWEPGTRWPDSLGPLRHQIRTAGSKALAVNDRRQIVGFEDPGSGGPGRKTAFLWHQEAMIDLNFLMEPGTDWHLESADDLNDAGQLIGTGYQPASSSTAQGFVMTLSSRAQDALRLCRGWCEPIRDCGEGGGQTLWILDGFTRFGGCVNGCLQAVLDPGAPHTLEEEFAVRECFLSIGAELCSQDWKEATANCCESLDLDKCDVYYP